MQTPRTDTGKSEKVKGCLHPTLPKSLYALCFTVFPFTATLLSSQTRVWVYAWVLKQGLTMLTPAALKLRSSCLSLQNRWNSHVEMWIWQNFLNLHILCLFSSLPSHPSNCSNPSSHSYYPTSKKGPVSHLSRWGPNFNRQCSTS